MNRSNNKNLSFPSLPEISGSGAAAQYDIQERSGIVIVIRFLYSRRTETNMHLLNILYIKELFTFASGSL
jgi:hypothetical protein